MRKLFFAICIAFFHTVALSQNWTGNVNSDWNNPSNWTGWPLGGDDLLVDPANYTGAGASPVISSASVFVPNSLTLQNGASLQMSASLTLDEDMDLDGAGTNFLLLTGTLNVGPGNNGRMTVSDGAQVIMNNGSILADQRLIIELGGKFLMNNGTVNIGETFAIGDGNAAGNSYFNLINGSVTVGTEMSFENELGNYYPTFEMEAGSLTVNGDITWFGAIPGSGIPRFVTRGGIVDVNGSIMNLPLSSVNMNFRIEGGAQVNVNGSGIDMSRASDSLLQAGTSVLQFNGTNTWNNNGVVIHQNSGNTHFAGNTTLQGSGSYSFFSIKTLPGGTLNHVSPFMISIGLAFDNDGTFIPNNNHVKFSGVMPGAGIGGSNPVTFHQLTVDVSPELLILTPVQVKNMLFLTNGVVTSSAIPNPLTILDNANSDPGSATSFVSTSVKKIGNDAFTFPVGKGGLWKPVSISAPMSTTAEFTAEYFNSAYSNTSSLNAPLTAVSTTEYWNITQTAGSDPYQVTLYWQDASASGISCSDLSIAQWNGSAWDALPGTISGSCAGSGSGSIQSSSTTSGNGPFTFGTAPMATAVGTINQPAFRCYPNPVNTNGKLHLETSTTAKAILISDAAGRQLFSLKPDTAVSDLDIPLQPGIYFISILSGSGFEQQKLIVQ
jgi:hypothetical protein